MIGGVNMGGLVPSPEWQINQLQGQINALVATVESLILSSELGYKNTQTLLRMLPSCDQGRKAMTPEQGNQ